MRTNGYVPLWAYENHFYLSLDVTLKLNLFSCFKSINFYEALEFVGVEGTK